MLPYVPPELRLVISHRFTVRKLVRPIRPGKPDTYLLALPRPLGGSDL